MKKIEILGPGCPRCEQLAASAKLAADQLGIEVELSKVTDIGAFPSYGLMMTPGLVLDGELKVQGKVPSVDEIKGMLS
ncbi:MAG: thioredoxin family protein [bacterium]|nr:thioredoxin family protein [bacterium]